MGAVAQCRVMGGVIGLAIVTVVFKSSIKARLQLVLSPNQVNELLRATNSVTVLPPEQRGLVRSILPNGYNLQMKISASFAAAQIPSSLIMWQRERSDGNENVALATWE